MPASLPITLSADERERFAVWLEQEAVTAEGLLEQMQAMRLPEAILNLHKLEAIASRAIAKKLRATESWTT